jgi:hypothetical protein
MPLGWTEQAAKATESPATMVLAELLRLQWKAHSNTFPVPNALLEGRGISQKVKYRVLRQLEQAGLINVKWTARKTPIVTLLLLREDRL